MIFHRTKAQSGMGNTLPNQPRVARPSRMKGKDLEFVSGIVDSSTPSHHKDMGIKVVILVMALFGNFTFYHLSLSLRT